MFDAVAQRYDLTNDVLSLGQDRRWRREVTAAVEAAPGDRVLDLAAGTGTSSQPFADAGAFVLPCDFSLGMLQVGKRARPALPFTAPKTKFTGALTPHRSVAFGQADFDDLHVTKKVFDVKITGDTAPDDAPPF